MNLSPKYVAIIGCMREWIMPFAISMPLKLIKRWYSMRQSDIPILQQFIKDCITLCYIKSEFNFILPIFMNQLERIASTRFIMRWSYKLSYINIFAFIVRIIRITTKCINRTIRLFLDFCKFLASLGRLSLAIAFGRTWLTSKNYYPSSFSLRKSNELEKARSAKCLSKIIKL